MFKSSVKNLRNISYKLGSLSGKGYSTIRNVEKKINEFDKGLAGVPGDLYRLSPASLFYNQTVVPLKQSLKIGEKVLKGIGENKKMDIATGIIDTLQLVSGGTNDFIDRGLQSSSFNRLFHSPYIQNYLNS